MLEAKSVNTCSMNRFNAKTELENSYRRSYLHGKSSFAALIDRFAFCALVGIGFFIISRASRIAPVPAVFMGLIASVIAFICADLYSNKRFAKHIRSKRSETETALRREKILLEAESEIEKRISSLSAEFPNAKLVLPRKAAPLTEDDVYSLFRAEKLHERGGVKAPPERLVVITLCPPTYGAVRCAERLRDPSIEFLPAEETEAFKDAFKVTSDEIDAAIISEYKTSERKPFGSLKKKLTSSELLSSGAGKYALLGAAFFAASFFMRYKLYFRSAAMLCFALYVRLRTYERLKLLRRIDRKVR